MWISKKEYEKLKDNETLIKRLKEGNPFVYPIELRDEFNKIKDNFEQKTIPFSTCYAERLEQLKRQFDKKPKPHVLIVDWEGDNSIDLEFSTMKEIEELCYKIVKPDSLVIFNYKNTSVQVYANNIISWQIKQGHPVPYTPEEIELWAKEQLEKELQNWKVVKEPYQPTSGIEVVMLQGAKEQGEAARRYYEQMTNAYPNFYTGIANNSANGYLGLNPKVW